MQLVGLLGISEKIIKIEIKHMKLGLENKHFDTACQRLSSLEGKTVAITGTTSGTGFSAAEACGKLGANVLLLNRPSKRADNAFALLEATNSNGKFFKIDCDLQYFQSVRSAAAETMARCPAGLDILCNNAGVMALKDLPTADGFDVQMQTNHLSHFLLTKLVFRLLQEAAQKRGEARIVNHSSMARLMVKKLNPKYLEKRGGNLGGDGTRLFIFQGGRWERYGQTKLANAAFTACLHMKLRDKNPKIKAMVAHPGVAETDLQGTAIADGGAGPSGGTGRWLIRQMMKMGQSQQDGAMGIIRCIADPEINSGQFVGPGMGMTALRGPALSYPLERFYDNPYTRDLLWDKSCEAIGEDFVI